MDTATTGFEGVPGRLAGAVMARLNRDMEVAAVDELAPAPGASVLAVGFGPGVGIAELVARLPHGQIAGVDPSATMVAAARQRNRAAVDTGRCGSWKPESRRSRGPTRPSPAWWRSTACSCGSRWTWRSARWPVSWRPEAGSSPSPTGGPLRSACPSTSGSTPRAPSCVAAVSSRSRIERRRSARVRASCSGADAPRRQPDGTLTQPIRH